MSTAQNTNQLEGRKFRFVVRDTQEAVRTIREHLGEHAHVLSVNQVQGKGIGRYLNAPKLEVVATVPRREPPVLEPKEQPEQQPEQNEEAKTAENSEKTPKETEKNAAPAILKEPEPAEENSLTRVLRKAGFDESLLGMLRCTQEWDTIKNASLGEGLNRVGKWLSTRFNALPERPWGERVAFIGTPGSGKTTMLCKRLGWEVLVNQSEDVQVFKAEDNTPNADDKLRVFCDVLDLNLCRDAKEIKKNRRLYMDVPGVPARDLKSWLRLRTVLDSSDIDTRVLVLNAAFSREVLRSVLDMGVQVGATHAVLTHVDEADNISRLWALLLRGGLPVSFYGDSQDLNGALHEDVCGFLMNRTFTNLS